MRVDLSGVGHWLPRLAWRLTTLIDQLIDLDVEVTNSTSKICRQHNVDLQTARLHYVAERGDRFAFWSIGQNRPFREARRHGNIAFCQLRL
jgi:hypothetical protein